MTKNDVLKRFPEILSTQTGAKPRLEISVTTTARTLIISTYYHYQFIFAKCGKIRTDKKSPGF